MIQYSRKPWYYKFNNSAFFSSDREEDFTKLFYKISIKSFEEFTQRLINMPRISLTQTIKVLEERNKIESNIMILYDKLKKAFDKIENIKNILETITIIKRDLNSSNKVLKSDLDTKIQILKKAKNELIKLHTECINNQSLILQSINLLKQIALNKDIFELSEEYIDSLIEMEKSERKAGYQERLEGLELLKQHKRTLREVYKGENKNMIKIKEFIDSLNNEHI